MIFWIIYIVGIFVVAPLIGRAAAKDYSEDGRKWDEVSPTTAAVVYGLMWPFALSLYALVLLYQSVPGVWTWFRLVLTGTKEKF